MDLAHSLCPRHVLHTLAEAFGKEEYGFGHHPVLGTYDDHPGKWIGVHDRLVAHLHPLGGETCFGLGLERLEAFAQLALTVAGAHAFNEVTLNA